MALWRNSIRKFPQRSWDEGGRGLSLRALFAECMLFWWECRLSAGMFRGSCFIHEWLAVGERGPLRSGLPGLHQHSFKFIAVAVVARGFVPSTIYDYLRAPVPGRWGEGEKDSWMGQV